VSDGGAGGGVGNHYRQRVGERVAQFSWLQRQDIVDAALETTRLSRVLFEDSVAGKSESSLFRTWVELMSAYTHYSAAFITNYAAFIGGLGVDIAKTKTDTLFPTRTWEFDFDLDGPPRLVRAWLVGGGAFDRVSLDRTQVVFTQTVMQMNSRVWTVLFDLSRMPSDIQLSGSYRVEVKVGEQTLVRYFYLDPQPGLN
jgi:hypothetical protein